MMVAGLPDNSVDRVARSARRAKEPLEKSIEAGYQIISAIIPFSGQAFDLLTSSNRWKKAAP
jgi:hypothetical protein